MPNGGRLQPQARGLDVLSRGRRARLLTCRSQVDDGSMDGAIALEKGDPLYDAQDDENYILVSGSEEALSRSPGRSNYDPERRRVSDGSIF